VSTQAISSLKMTPFLLDQREPIVANQIDNPIFLPNRPLSKAGKCKK